MHKLQVEAAPQASAKLWTPANIVTLIRICLVPVFVVVLLSPWPEWFHLPDLRRAFQKPYRRCHLRADFLHRLA